MSKIEDLIEKLCPSGVPFIKLQEMAEIGTGRSDRKNAVENGEYPFYVRSKEVLKINKYEFDETAIIIPGEGGIGEIFHYVAGKYALHQRAYRIHVIDNKLRTKYLYYYMFEYFKKFIMTKAVTATVTSIRKPMIEQFPIAVPPLEVQDEIVHILDDFTLLSAELSAELKARQQQYKHYLHYLLDIKDGDEMTIGDIYDFKYGTGNTIPQGGGEYPVYGSNGMVGYYSEYNSEDAPVIGHIGAYAGIVNWAKGKHFVTYNGVICKHKNINVNKKYAYYILLTQDFIGEQKGAQPFVSYDALKKPTVKIPSLKEQERIVDILDRFDKLCNDISEGLPAEIEARQKQYEYYRDKLLTFKELEENEEQ